MEPFIRFSLLQQRKWVKEAEKSIKYPFKRLSGQKIPIKLPLTLEHDILDEKLLFIKETNQNI